MHPRALELINLLKLAPHPEGGYFREIFRSSDMVQVSGEMQQRNALTEIYFLLTSDGASRWHQVGLDEVWHFYEGAPLALFWLDIGERKCNRHRLGEAGKTSRPVAVVPANCWQCARTTGAYTLVGCSVAPGFEFTDFRLLRESQEAADVIRKRFPDLAGLV
jgi:hypothetical protein